MLQSPSKPRSSSASISVAFPPEQYPSSLNRAMEVFARFGDIARIDMTLGLATGRLLVTFFDVRAAQQALEVFKDKAEVIPPAAYDFHAVSIAFAEWPSTVTSFRNFGEIAGASICGEDMLVEFYDMRAAQQVFFSVPGCRPWPPQSVSANQANPSKNDMGLAKATATVAAKAVANANVAANVGTGALPPQALFHTLKESLARVEYALDAVSRGSPEATIEEPCQQQGAPGLQALGSPNGSLLSAIAGLGSTGGTPWLNLDHQSVSQSGSHQSGVSQSGSSHQNGSSYSEGSSSMAGPLESLPASFASMSTAASAKVQEPREPRDQQAAGGATVPAAPGPGKPVREKVKSKDLTKFDIIPDRVLSGEDDRTTMMVRNIGRTCSREYFVEFLINCGLEDKYTFFYMPFDKRRNTHCGLAFVNLKLPQDVLKLQMGVESFLSQKGQTSAPPAVSYARLQGDDELMKHFSLSAVMNGNDVRKRPMFLAGAENAQDCGHNDEDIVLGMPARIDIGMSQSWASTA